MGHAPPAKPAYMYVSHVVPQVEKESDPEPVTMGPRSIIYIIAGAYGATAAKTHPDFEPFHDVDPYTLTSGTVTEELKPDVRVAPNNGGSGHDAQADGELAPVTAEKVPTGHVAVQVCDVRPAVSP